ncbi:6-carboxytetrahydropterin synthase QueD [bacterium]|nr:6-carboxytetrahydropterin synthase QueD [bacterium]
MYELKVESSFSAAHHLLNYNGECENQHGHNWKTEVYIRGSELDKSNLLIDFKMLKKELNKVLDTLDHKDINTLEVFKGISPSSETLSRYIYTEMKKVIPCTYKVSVWETEKACASYFEE